MASTIDGVIPQSLATQIATQVAAVVASPPMEYQCEDDAPSSFAPDAALITDVVNSVFWASVEREEGRSVLPRVAIGDLPPFACHIVPSELCPGILRKLSPFFDNPQNFTYCSQDRNITGVSVLNTLDVSVHSERPGTIVISHVYRVLAVLEGGVWRWFNRERETLTKVLADAFGEEDLHFKEQKARALIQLAQSARIKNRGAMFVTVPPNSIESPESGLTQPEYKVSRFNAGREALVEDQENLFRWADDSEKYDETRRLVAELRDKFDAVVSSGAGIDGATLLNDTDLRPVGFGSKIVATCPETEVVMLEPPFEERQTVSWKTLGGMRHQSAARLVQQNHAATVVTVSQDGTISLFVWHQRSSRVVVLRHLDLFLRSAPLC